MLALLDPAADAFGRIEDDECLSNVQRDPTIVPLLTGLRFDLNDVHLVRILERDRRAITCTDSGIVLGPELDADTGLGRALVIDVNLGFRWPLWFLLAASGKEREQTNTQ